MDKRQKLEHYEAALKCFVQIQMIMIIYLLNLCINTKMIKIYVVLVDWSL